MKREPLWRRYLRFFGPDVRADVDEEIQLHFELRVQDYVRDGRSPDAARARVQAEFGDINRARQECRSIGEGRLREHRRARLLDGLKRDLGFGVRRALRSPGFSLTAILTLALGLGATAAIFSVVHGVLLRPLPFPDPDRLVRLYEIAPTGDVQNPVSSGNYLDWRQRSTGFEVLGAHYWPYEVSLTGAGDPARVVLNDLTPEALRALNPRPLLGRLFTADDGLDPSARFVLVSYGFWRDRLGGDSSAIGQTVTVDEIAYEILGVMRPDFDFPSSLVDLWRPVSEAGLNPDNRRSHNLGVIARLKPGTTVEPAQAEMTTIAKALQTEYPEFMKGWGVNVVKIHSDLVAPVRPLLLVLLSGVGLVLVIACSNVANLLLARAVGREREISVRGALGASRLRLVRQLLVEGAILAVAAGLLGVFLAQAMLAGLIRLAPSDIPLLDEVRLDRTVLGFALLLTAASTLVFALAPALRLAGTDLQAALRADRSGALAHARLRGALVVFEVALSMVLLVGAGLLVRSFTRLQAVDLGFAPDGMLAVSLSPSAARYPDAAAQTGFYQRLLERLDAVPGVAGATSTSATPADPYSTTFSFAIQGRESPNPSGRFDPVPMEAVMPGYFSRLGIPLRRGRTFDSRDRADAPPVAVINETLARVLWPGTDPIGQRIAFRTDAPWLEIVGVVGDTRMLGADRPPAPILYLPFSQKTWAWLRWQTVLIRADAGLNPVDLLPAIRAAAAEVDPQLVLPRVSTVNQLYAESAARRRFATLLLGGFAAAALALGLIGVYGVLSTAVAQRSQELAIRVALGAGRSRVIALILRQALSLTLAGVAIGLLAAAGATRLLGSLLFGVSPLDPVTFGAVGAILLLVSAGAALIPAWRAARVDPIGAMRGG
ncbi:MAG TPA: ABC transporter permease [Gemmatimonadales bacterium]